MAMAKLEKAAAVPVPETPPTPSATPMSATAPMSARSVKWGDLEDAAGGLERPLLRQRGSNTTSQMAVVGTNVCPIESLDYECVSLNPIDRDPQKFVLNSVLICDRFQDRGERRVQAGLEVEGEDPGLPVPGPQMAHGAPRGIRRRPRGILQQHRRREHRGLQAAPDQQPHAAKQVYLARDHHTPMPSCHPKKCTGNLNPIISFFVASGTWMRSCYTWPAMRSLRGPQLRFAPT